MADTKISALTVATTPLAGTEVLPIVQSGVTKQVSVANLTAGRAVSADSLSLTNALTAANGGTGQSSYAVGDLLYASTTTALSKLADVATGNALISGGVGVAPSWGKIGLATHVSGTLGTGNGGTGLTSFTANGILYASSTSALATSALLTWNGGNLCVDATPPAWLWPSGATGIIQLRANGALSAYNASTYLSQNWYYNAGEKFIDNGYAMRYDQTSGKHVWYVSNASNAGGAGASVTWLQVMQTHASGGVSIGNTTDPGATNLYASGKIGIGVTPSYLLDIYRASAGQWTHFKGTNTSEFSETWMGTDSGDNPNIVYQAFNNSTGGMYYYLRFGGTTSTYDCFAFDSGGNAYKSSGAGTWSALSDSKIKTNVQPVSGGLSRILQLKPVTFDYKQPSAHNDKVTDKGFIADDFMQIYPDSVKETEVIPVQDRQYFAKGEKAKSMAYNSEFYADLVSAIQELKAEFEAYKASHP